jgi:hypothetical protein
LTRGSILVRKKPDCFLRKKMDCRLTPGNDGIGIHALSRLRPRARRAAITLRPPFFAMRARKPWRRLRTSLLG